MNNKKFKVLGFSKDPNKVADERQCEMYVYLWDYNNTYTLPIDKVITIESIFIEELKKITPKPFEEILPGMLLFLEEEEADRFVTAVKSMAAKLQ